MSEPVDPNYDSVPRGNACYKIGHYQILRSLGIGGMGEVFLVYDPVCERKAALKKIKPLLINHPIIKKRFLKEARYASKLSHPNIIPIYSIYVENDDLYYTMPYIEGETLKEIIKNTLEKEKRGEAPHEIGVSIPSLARIFLSICQAMSFSHSKGVLHRDIKPENIMVGKYGEVFVLDWGIATYMNENNQQVESDTEDQSIELEAREDLTMPGKVLGTVNYMAPERALKNPATVQSEIYSLGVILYQILTLSLPFKRKSLEHFRKILKFEDLVAPEEKAPYRDIPKQLSEVCQKCLAANPSNRYEHVDEVITDVKNYIEGRPEWIPSEELNIDEKSDWEFQENILLSKHMAITRITDVMEWVALMISKKNYPGNLKLEFSLKLPHASGGIGILLCIPEPSERNNLEEGYCLWIGASSNPYSTLFRSNAEVLSIPDNGMKQDHISQIKIEKIDNTLRFYVDGHIKLNYLSHIPIIGTHLGLIYKDPDFEISNLKIYTGSKNVMVNCLSIPDTLLASKNFNGAYSEYKKISHSFEGRTEGREAQFRAGLTLIEQAKRSENEEEKKSLLAKAFDEFESLKATPGAPLEYLGKSIICHVEDDQEDEVKCLELAMRKYPRHPMLSILKEHIIFRLHESSKTDRAAAYGFSLMCLKLVPEVFSSYENKKLIDNLVKHWTPLNFIDHEITFFEKKYEYLHFAIIMAFFLKKPRLITETLDKLPEELPEKKQLVANALFCLYYLGERSLAKQKLTEAQHLLSNISNPDANYLLDLFGLMYFEKSPEEHLKKFFKMVPKKVTLKEFRVFQALIESSKAHLSYEEVLSYIKEMQSHELNSKLSSKLKNLHIYMLLYYHETDLLTNLLLNMKEQELKNPKNPLYFYYGCYLYKCKSQSAALEHFKALEDDIYPVPHIIASQILSDRIHLKDFENMDLFDFEKCGVYDFLEIFYLSLGKNKKAGEFQKKSKSLLQHSF